MELNQKLRGKFSKLRFEILITFILICLSIASALLTQVISYSVYFEFSSHIPIGFKVINSSTHDGNFSINRAFISSYGGDTITLFLNVSNRANNKISSLFKIYCSSENSTSKLTMRDLNLSVSLDSKELNMRLTNDSNDSCFSYMSSDICMESNKIELQPRTSYIMKVELTTSPSIYPTDYKCILQFEAI